LLSLTFEPFIGVCLTLDIVQTPLIAIVNYLEMAMDNKVDEKTRVILNKAQKASHSLIYVVDELLKLTEVEDETAHAVNETFNLDTTGESLVKAYRL
jgi:signal transduction histidine kinase